MTSCAKGLIGWAAIVVVPVIYAGLVGANDLGVAEAASESMGTTHVCLLNDGTFVTADGGCKDTLTGLVWSTYKLGNAGSWTYSPTLELVSSSTEGGYDDWRLPTREEWLTAIAHGAAVAFEPDYRFETNSRYWTSEAQGNRFAWTVIISTAETEKQPQTAALVFGAVREAGSPPPPPPPTGCDNDGVCELNESCETCPNDCAGKTNGPPSGRYCCGNGIAEPAEGDGTICDGNY